MIGRDRPKIGLLGVMQELYDDMIPGITDHQAAYARELAASFRPLQTWCSCALRGLATTSKPSPRSSTRRVDGIMIVMLTYGPAMRTVRALLENPLPGPAG